MTEKKERGFHSMELLMGENPLLTILFFNLVETGFGAKKIIRRQDIQERAHKIRFNQDINGHRSIHSLSVESRSQVKLTGFAIPIQASYPLPEHGCALLQGLKARAFLCAKEMNRISQDGMFVCAYCNIVGTEDSAQNKMYANIYWTWRTYPSIMPVPGKKRIHT